MHKRKLLRDYEAFATFNMVDLSANLDDDTLANLRENSSQ